jgi:trehalose/maltose hydrolase-like predicted phosphorylase
MVSSPSAAEERALDGRYTRGDYFENPHRHGEDAEFKASRFLSLLHRNLTASQTRIESYVDVGCGSGDVVRLVSKGMRNQGFDVRQAGDDIDLQAHRHDLRSGFLSTLGAAAPRAMEKKCATHEWR